MLLLEGAHVLYKCPSIGLHQTHRFLLVFHCSKGVATGMIVIGEVVLAHMHQEVATKTPHSGKDVVDISKYYPVSRLGGISYGRTTEYYDIPRPPKDWQEKAAYARSADEKAKL